ncbi:MAG: fumarylacetoacetase, partial [Bryobacteraceae bacterium]
MNEASGWERRSWVESANDPASAFPITNVPFGVYQHGRRAARIGVAIGDSILDVSGCLKDRLFRGAAAEAAAACRGDRLNELMTLPAGHSAALRSRLIEILGEGSDDPRPLARLHPMSECVMHLPAAIGDYTDFYSSIHHAANVGALFRPDNPLLPNYKYIPIAYHGRASSIVPSGASIVRPQGQTRPDAPAPPEFGPSRMLDYECELGFFVRLGNKLGEPVPIQEAESRL